MKQNNSIKIYMKETIGGILYQVVDNRVGDMPRVEGVMSKSLNGAIKRWLYPNSDQTKIKKFIQEVVMFHRHEGYNRYHNVETHHRRSSRLFYFSNKYIKP